MEKLERCKFVKALILSDLHTEFYGFVPRGEVVRDVDLVVLAGDIAKGTSGITWARIAFPSTRIVYVAGNHEFYGGDWERTLDDLRYAAAALDVDFLENNEIEHMGVRILGCTLWVDFGYFGRDRIAAAMREYELGLNDCSAIRTARGRLTANEVLQRHVQSIGWLGNKVAERQVPTMVVTHHAPCIQSVEPRYVDDDLTPGFVSELPLALLYGADIWVHGHMHHSVDYVLTEGKPTRVVCNPRGYPLGRRKPENDAFDPGMVVTL